MGPRGMVVAFVGSLLPIILGFLLACGFEMVYYGQITKFANCFCVGAAFAPSSMGIVLNVLRSTKTLNTPMGQLVIAAAIVDDVLGLMLLTELQAINNLTVVNIVVPLISSPILIALFGFLAVKIMPKILKKYLEKVKPELKEYFILVLIFMCLLVMVPVCDWIKTSHLLGAFLTGLLFCTESCVHRAWTRQVKRLMQWLMRIFFGATLAFSVPIKEFASLEVILQSIVYCFAISGKLFVGIFAKPFDKMEFFKLALSTSTWGEFSFLIATVCLKAGTLTMKQNASIILTVLISIVIVPFLLRRTLIRSNELGKERIKQCRNKSKGIGKDEVSKTKLESHSVFYVIDTKSVAHWRQQDHLLHIIMNVLNLEIIDYRTWHEHHCPKKANVFNELYVKDLLLKLEPTRHLNPTQKHKLQQRTKLIRNEIQKVLHINECKSCTTSNWNINKAHGGKVIIRRWLPYIKSELDHKEPHLRQSVEANNKDTYCPTVTAYQQARHALQQSKRDRILKSSGILSTYNENDDAWLHTIDEKLNMHNSSANLLSTVSRMHSCNDDLVNRHHLFDGLVHSDYHDLITYLDCVQPSPSHAHTGNKQVTTNTNDSSTCHDVELSRHKSMEHVYHMRMMEESHKYGHSTLNTSVNNVMNHSAMSLSTAMRTAGNASMSALHQTSQWLDEILTHEAGTSELVDIDDVEGDALDEGVEIKVEHARDNVDQVEMEHGIRASQDSYALSMTPITGADLMHEGGLFPRVSIMELESDINARRSICFSTDNTHANLSKNSTANK